jgi:hypothetical protein
VDGLVVAAAAAGAVVAHVLDHLTIRLEFAAPLPENINVFRPSSLKLMPVSPNTSYGHLHPLRGVGLLLEVDAVHHVLDACAPRPSERARDARAEVRVHAQWRLRRERVWVGGCRTSGRRHGWLRRFSWTECGCRSAHPRAAMAFVPA